MSLQKPEKIENFEQLNKFAQDLYNNLSIGDMRPSDVRTEVPTEDTLDKGRFAIYDDGTNQRIYIRTLDGTIKSVTFL